MTHFDLIQLSADGVLMMIIGSFIRMLYSKASYIVERMNFFESQISKFQTKEDVEYIINKIITDKLAIIDYKLDEIFKRLDQITSVTIKEEVK